MSKFGKWIFFFALIAIFCVPLIAPLFFFWAGVIIWPIVYISVYVQSLGFDPTRELPVVFQESSIGFDLVLILIATFVGCIRDLPGALAMFVNWTAILFLFHFYVWVGMGVNMSREDWIEKNYQEVSCEPVNVLTCRYEPKNNLKLPSFTIDKTAEMGGKIIDITPWAAQKIKNNFHNQLPIMVR